MYDAALIQVFDYQANACSGHLFNLNDTMALT